MKTVPFIIVADLRTGSTLLSSTLNRHPQVRCLGELFHPVNLPDNQIPGIDRFEHTGRSLIEHAFDPDGKKAVGFKAMVFLPPDEFSQWSDAWQTLSELRDLRVIFLRRKDSLAQYVSFQIARRTGKFHPSPGDPILEPRNRPRITIDPEEVRAWTYERKRLSRLREEQLGKKNAIYLDYSTLAGRWKDTMVAVQAFLQIDPMQLPPAKQKQETRRISQAIGNFEELEKAGLTKW